MRHRNISIDTIARLSGFSRSTVSRVIGNYGYASENARRTIKKIIDKYNYRPSSLARSMVSGKTNTIGLLLTDICNPFYSIVARSVENVVSKYNYTLIICNCDESLDKEQKNIELLIEKQVDGLIISPTVDENGNINHIFFDIKKYDIPVINIDRPLPEELNIPSITVDNRNGGYKATRYLMELGHRRIGIVTSKLPIPNVRDREKGYLQALHEAGVGMKNGDRIELESRENELDMSLNLNIFSKIERFTALFATTNLFSIATLRILKKMRLYIPGDISFIGFDDLHDADIMVPPPTVIAQPAVEVGTTAARIILEMIRGDKAKSINNIVLPVNLIVRESCEQNIN